MAVTSNTTRRRNVEVSTKVEIPQEVKDLAKEVYLENLRQNEAKKKHDKARNTLLGKMKELALKAFTFQFVGEGGKKVSVDVKVETPERSYIDIATLRKLVTAEQFDAIISASATDVENVAGKVVAIQCKRTTTGNENVYVKAAK